MARTIAHRSIALTFEISSHGEHRSSALRSVARHVASLVLLGVVSFPAFAQEDQGSNPGVSGEHDFNLYCASCHGEDGRGGGPKAFGLSVKPPDLTTLTARHGSFPADRIARIIDGRDVIAAHEEREMPVWGTLFKLEAGEELGQAQGDDGTVARRIANLIDYIGTLQQPQ
jgi:hypothetical protein